MISADDATLYAGDMLSAMTTILGIEPMRGRSGPFELLRCGGTITAAYLRDGQTLVEAELWARAALTAALPRRTHS